MSINKEHQIIKSNNLVFLFLRIDNHVQTLLLFQTLIMLYHAYLQEDIVVNCTTVFGGIDIFVPANVNVQVSSVPIFGAVSNHVKNRNAGAPTIFINATCMFGGIDIK